MADTKQFTPFSPAEVAALEALDPPIDAPTPYGAHALPTFEIALVLAGAVSAGAYTAGVLDYLLETLDLWEAEKARLSAAGVPLDQWTVPPHAVRLRVVSGASAGSICAALLGIATRYRFAPASAAASAADKRANLFYRAWVEDIDILPLLGTSDLAGAAPPLTSLLDSAPLEAILADALDFSAPPAPPRPFFGSSLAVFMTLSNLRGVPYNFPLTGTPGLVYGASRHADAVRFRIVFSAAAPVRPDEVAVTGSNRATHAEWRRVGDVALASAAFPIGLKPRRLDRPTVHYSWLPYIRYVSATPANAAQNGSMPSGELTAKPISVRHSTTSAKRGMRASSTTSRGTPRTLRSEAKKKRNTTYSIAIATSHGPAINPANVRKLTPDAPSASRFVRFDTGSSNEPALARCVQA